MHCWEELEKSVHQSCKHLILIGKSCRAQNFDALIDTTELTLN